MATSLELAITAIRSGRKEEGRQLLNLLIQQNPNDEMAWLWMSSVVNTDEQRARCLYHVLAINPESDIARRGLEVLGIVVSDSRPVKIPRDSQPIPIQRTGEPLPEIPTPPVTPAPAAERRPFRVDPRAITQELPFKPLKEPFTQTSAETAPTSDPQVVEAPAAVANEQRGHPSAFKQVTNASSTLSRLTEKLEQVTQSSGPAPAASTASAGPDTQTAQANSSSAAQTNPDLAAHYALPALPAGGGAIDTRPSQPIIVPHTHSTVAMPSPWQPPQPTPEATAHSQVTMGMATQYVQPQNPWQPAPPFHANQTMGMPASPHQPGLGYGQPQPSAEPVSPMPASAPMSMPGYGPQPYQQPWPQNPAFFSNVTMAMPTMTPVAVGPGYGFQQPGGLLGGLRASPTQAGFTDYRAAQGNRSAKRKGKAKDSGEEEEEEVNVLAIIIFGSLSLTALGGLGMLILLMATGG
jgi:hypothetical protein